MGTLTVQETLLYSHALRMPKDVHEREAQSTVDAIVRVLNLGKVQHARVGTPLKRGISGGERRRLNIGIEMVTSPAILFIDEPTSGLDARNALRVMRAILRLCQTGRTILCTIHQPRSNVFFMFQSLMLMHLGRTVYFGQADKALEYFERMGYACPRFVNPVFKQDDCYYLIIATTTQADFLIDVIEDGEEGEESYAIVIGEEDQDEEDEDTDQTDKQGYKGSSGSSYKQLIDEPDESSSLLKHAAKPIKKQAKSGTANQDSTSTRVDPTKFSDVFPTTPAGQALARWLEDESQKEYTQSNQMVVLKGHAGRLQSSRSKTLATPPTTQRTSTRSRSGASS